MQLKYEGGNIDARSIGNLCLYYIFWFSIVTWGLYGFSFSPELWMWICFAIFMEATLVWVIFSVGLSVYHRLFSRNLNYSLFGACVSLFCAIGFEVFSPLEPLQCGKLIGIHTVALVVGLLISNGGQVRKD